MPPPSSPEKRVLCLSAVVFLGLGWQAQAQEHALAPTPTRLQYVVSGEGFWLAGNTSRLILGGRGVFTVFPHRPHRFVLRPSYFYGRVNGRITDREARTEGLLYLFADRYPDRPVYGFVLGIYSQSHLRRVDRRWQSGLGIGIHAWRSDQHHLTASIAVLAEETTFAPRTVRRSTRTSFRLEALTHLAEQRLRLGAETFFKPALTQRSDVFWLTLLTLDLAISPHLAIRLAFDHTYAAVVPSGLKAHDLRLTFGLSIQN